MPFPPTDCIFVNLGIGGVQAQAFLIRICGQHMKYGFPSTIVSLFLESGLHRLLGTITLPAVGSPRHCAPLQMIQSMPLCPCRLSFRGRPCFLPFLAEVPFSCFPTVICQVILFYISILHSTLIYAIFVF